MSVYLLQQWFTDIHKHACTVYSYIIYKKVQTYRQPYRQSWTKYFIDRPLGFCLCTKLWWVVHVCTKLWWVVHVCANLWWVVHVCTKLRWVVHVCTQLWWVVHVSQCVQSYEVWWVVHECTNLWSVVHVCLPWYNRTGWLGVKHQFTYWLVHVCTKLWWVVHVCTDLWWVVHVCTIRSMQRGSHLQSLVVQFFELININTDKLNHRRKDMIKWS